MIDIEKLPEFDEHELVIRLSDEKTGLRGFIAIHNTNVGPAVGGTRYCHYASEEEALRDALRLSRAMTYKCALARVPYGGGKAVLIAPRSPAAAKKLKNEKYLAAYAKKLHFVAKDFFTGEDVGMTEKDIEILAKRARNIIGKPNVGGMPSEWAAKSVFESMRAALKEVFGSDSFDSRTIAIKGLGNVGLELAHMLTKEGAKIIAAETNPERVSRARSAIKGIRIVSPVTIHKQKADIFSPCALSADLSKETIPYIKAKIVCGAANNQLATPEDGHRLFKKKILYVPDYIANGGGLINVVDELHRNGYSRPRVEKNVHKVRATVADILKTSRRRRQPTSVVADRLGYSRFSKTK